MTTKPTYSRAEIKQREELLTKCFQACDFVRQAHHSQTSQTNSMNPKKELRSFIDPTELEVVARCFNTQANVDQEVKVIFGKLDKNQDGMIDLREWVSVLFDLFRFMSAGAFDKHCEELLALLKKAHPDGVHLPPVTQ